MSNVFLFLCSLSALFIPSSFAFSSSDQTFVSQHLWPSFFEDNNEALKARIQLLDQAPPGSRVKIATFVFDNGSSTRLLAQHLCRAASPAGPKKLHITLLANSNTGCRPGVDDCFDKSEKIQINEEIYQYLANCGVDVRIHNVIPDEFYLIGQFSKNRYPVLKDQPDVRFLKVIEHYHDVIKEFQKAFEAHFQNIPRYDIPDMTVDLKWPLHQKDLFTSAYRLYRGKDLKIWNMLTSSHILYADPVAVKGFIHSFFQKIYEDHPVLSEAFKRIQVLNRINHRKLFLVQTQEGQGCFFLGGRNLGDHYLSWSPQGDQFIDGDVLYCSEQSSQVMDGASKSFDELLEQTKDPVMDNIIYKIEPQPDYPFKLLSFDDQKKYSWSPQVYQKPKKSKKLENHERALPPLWEQPEDGLRASSLTLKNAEETSIKTSSWNKKEDLVWQDLLTAIDQEQELIYLETAYGEFHEKLRAKLEQALKRGVKVHIVTNSFLLLDGVAKAIRIFMATWVNDMMAQYGASQFRYEVATVHGGHMIHFKGFGFRNQKTASGHRKFFGVGSHNFHPRSGLFDKEHAIHWYEPRVKKGFDLIDMRKQYYDRLSWDLRDQLQGKTFLKQYGSLYEELTSELAYIKNKDPKLYKIGKSIKKTFFNRKGEVKDGEKGLLLLEHVRDSGLQDFFGVFL